MTTLTASHSHRSRRFRLAREAAYGALPDTPDWHTVPLLPDGPGLAGRLQVQRPPGAPAASGHVASAQVAGEFACPGLPSSMELLLDLALARSAGGQLQSWTADACAPDDSRRLTGLVLDELTCTLGTDGSRLNARALGRQEWEHSALSPADFDAPGPDLAPYALRHAQITLGGMDLSGVRELTLRVQNAVRPGPPEAEPAHPRRPAWMSAGPRTVTLGLRCLAAAGPLRTLHRSGASFAVDIALQNTTGRTLSLQIATAYCRSVRRAPAATGAAECRAELAVGADAGGTDITWTATP
jgi:hypothetical protein